jgi:hypothetical protein
MGETLCEHKKMQSCSTALSSYWERARGGFAQILNLGNKMV